MANSKIRNAGVHHIAISASDFEKSLDFYVKGMGMTPMITWGEGNSRAAMLDIGNGSCIELFSGGRKYDEKDSSWLHLAILTTNTDHAYQNALAAGAVCKMEPKDSHIPSSPYSQTVRIAFVYGPDNEVLEFFQYK